MTVRTETKPNNLRGPQIEFSHMPEVGVSYGVQKVGGKVILSAAFTNTEAGDVFSKKRARQIISGRIRTRINGRKTLTHIAESSKTALQIVKDMRATFKPGGWVNEGWFVTQLPIDNDGATVNVPTVRLKSDGVPAGKSVWEQLVNEFKRVA